MSATRECPMAFYHQDGLVPAWNFAAKYAGEDGSIAAMPDIVEIRVASKPGTPGSPWDTWYASSSAEYYGVGADGRLKIIVAHGVGPMATIEGVKSAYKWQWGDKSRNNQGGRISAEQFLALESGVYGRVKVVGATDFFPNGQVGVKEYDIAPVNVIDFQSYLDEMGYVDGSDIFYRYLTLHAALSNPLLWMRLGSQTYDYLMLHEQVAKSFHSSERPNDKYPWSKGFDDRKHPYIIQTEMASNCSYMQLDEMRRRGGGSLAYIPRQPEPGLAWAHLLSIDGLMRVSVIEYGTMLLASPGVHEWSNGAKFIGIPSGVSLSRRLKVGPDPSEVICKNWQNFMRPVEEGYVSVAPFKLSMSDGGWFANYPKERLDVECMDSGDIEFHVRSAVAVGGVKYFSVDEDFFLRYKLSQVISLMPDGANAYRIIDISRKDNHGLTTVQVQFYRADVDTSQRLPRIKEVAHDFDRLMAAFEG